jgi:hypothetical protein
MTAEPVRFSNVHRDAGAKKKAGRHRTGLPQSTAISPGCFSTTQ